MLQAVSPDARVIRPLESFAWSDGNEGYLRARPEGPGERVPAFVAELLLEVTGLETIAQVARRYGSRYTGLKRWSAADRYIRYAREGAPADAGSGDKLERALQSILLQLAGRGHLQRGEDFGATASEASPRIEVLVIPTADRPALLARALESYLGNLRQFGRTPRVVIGDDSRDPANVEANRGHIALARKTSGLTIEHLGRAERAGLIEEHARGDAHRRAALEFLLVDEGHGPTYGMSRNALLLAAAGKLLFSADDDTLCNLFAPKAPEGLRWVERGEPPQRLSRWPDRPSARAQLQAVEQDLLAAHERLLGRSPLEVVGAAVRAGSFEGSLSSEQRSALAAGQGRVLLTVNGLVGDSASALSPVRSMLEARGDEAARIFAAPHAAALAGSREVVKASDGIRLASSAGFMATFFGFDARGPFTPFFPYFRREEVGFLEALRRTRAPAPLAFLPLALEHAPQGTVRPEVPVVGMSEVVLAALFDVAPATALQGESDLARALGHRVVDFAEQPPARYRHQVQEITLLISLQVLATQRAALRARAGSLPEAAVEEADRALAALEKTLTLGPLTLADPALVQALGSADAAEALTRTLLARWGRALVALA